MKLFRTIGVLGNKFSVFLRYTGGKMGQSTRGYVVRGNMFRIRSSDDVDIRYYLDNSKDFAELDRVRTLHLANVIM